MYFFNWSTGKDSALALYQLLQQGIPVTKLLTTLHSSTMRVSMHGISLEMVKKQIEALGLDWMPIYLPKTDSMERYNEIIGAAIDELKKQGYTHAAFGDIFLEDLRLYREKQLEKAGLKAVFPLWKQDTYGLVNRFTELGFKAVVVCVNAKYMDASFVGCELDENFIKRLPQGVDPCGENGNFIHSFMMALCLKIE